jgi:hypothetical protein
MVRWPFLAVVFLACASAPAGAQLAEEKTPGLRVVYVDGSESFLVPHATRTTLNALAFQKKLFDYEPSKDLTVLLMDLADTGNGGATSVPHDLVRVQIAPLDVAFETIPANERMNTIMNHELVHVATMDRTSARDRAFRRLFGGKVLPLAEHPESVLYFYLTAPRVAAPRWFQEGIAVFVDTWMAGGIGRAQGGYDEMVFRTMVRDGAEFHDPLGLVSEGTKVDFQLEINSYLYGTRFMTWLAHRYSPEQVIAWTSRREGSRAYYSAQFQQVFGATLGEAWDAWIEDEHRFQQANLSAIREHPITPFIDVTSHALGSVSRAYFDPVANRIYAGFNYPGVAAHIGAIDARDGSIDRIASIKGPIIYTVASLAWDAGERALFYTTDNGGWRDLMRLDVDTGRTRLLQRDARIGDLVHSPPDGSLWGIRRANAICTLVRMSRPHTSWEEVASWPYGIVVYDLDISPDGRTLAASFGDISGDHEVRLFDVAALQAGDVTPRGRFGFQGSPPNGFTFSADGRHLYGTSYYTGVSNVFRYDLAARTLESVSNTDTGFFRPVPLDGDRLLVFRYTGKGFVPSWIDAMTVPGPGAITFLGERLAAKHPVVDTWNVGSPLGVDYEALDRDRRQYRPAGSLRLESLYPIVQGYKNAAAVGLRLNLSDPVQLNRASVTASFTPGGLPSNERLHLRAEYQRYDWRARASLNDADFYDLFGPTKTSRKGYDFRIGRTHTLVFDEPRRLTFDVNAALLGGLDRVPEYQNVAADVRRLAALDARLMFTDVQHSLGSVDDETGTRWTIRGDARYVNGQLVPRIHADFARGLALPAGHSSLWFRHWAGFSPRSRDLAFANFYFGGFGNNFVDAGHEKRYRESYAFPGVGINGTGGRNFVKSMMELNLPPVRFAHAGTPGLHATWMRPALFMTALVTDMDAPARRPLANAGAQVDFRLSLLSVLEATVSVGGAIAFEPGDAPRRELMVSLKVLR